MNEVIKMLALLVKAFNHITDALMIALIGKPEPKEKKAVVVTIKKNTDVPPVNKYAAEIEYFDAKFKKILEKPNF